jgi:pyruvate/2-oxoglutarate dehydrogenase complex dihydrolipoamide dehydrogenase (E3) component
MEKFDSVIIGFGKGGKTLAGYLAGKGEKVAVIEKSDTMYGGTCINVGCIPTKSLVEGARHAAAVKNASPEVKKEMYRQAVIRKRELVSMLRNKNYHMLADQDNITVYNGEASFVDDHVLNVVGAHEAYTVRGNKIFINTGSRADVPFLAGMSDSSHVYLSGTMMDVDTLPNELVVVGGGYIGLEFASFYQLFGSHVTILQHSGHFLPREDSEVAAAVLQSLRDRGIQVLFHAEIESISDQNGQAVLSYQVQGEPQQIKADAVLFATGRRADTARLDAEAAGLTLKSDGSIPVDEHRRTVVPHIWAMGDVIGEQQFTYVSLDDFRIVKSSLTDGAYTALGRNIPHSMFIDPPLSRVGLTEEEAQQQGFMVATAVLPAAAIPKAHVLQKPVGMLKAVVDAKTGYILGATLFCEESHEVINIIKLAMDHQLPYTTLRDQIFTHPTMSEALNDLFGKIAL